jgi:hypothetical protein
MKTNQISNTTIYNRHPEIFSECLKIIGDNKTILSFGCSYSEVKTLKDLYFVHSQIDGIDIDSNIIHNLNIRNDNTDLSYYDSFENIKTTYHVAFCMSVLTRNPDPDNSYTFELFEETLALIDKYIKLYGFICIWNSRFEFSESKVAEKYICISTDHKDSGFTQKKDKYGNLKTNDYPYILFQKIII